MVHHIGLKNTDGAPRSRKGMQMVLLVRNTDGAPETTEEYLWCSSKDWGIQTVLLSGLRTEWSSID
jgi:hypothetical protein